MGWKRDDGEPWVFPELDRSFKQIFCVQCVFTSIGVGVAWHIFGALIGVITLVIVGLVWCAMIQAGINNARVRKVTQEINRNKMLARSMFDGPEGRLLDRSQMAPEPPLAPTEDYGRAEEYGG